MTPEQAIDSYLAQCRLDFLNGFAVEPESFRVYNQLYHNALENVVGSVQADMASRLGWDPIPNPEMATVHGLEVQGLLELRQPKTGLVALKFTDGSYHVSHQSAIKFLPKEKEEKTKKEGKATLDFLSLLESLGA